MAITRVASPKALDKLRTECQKEQQKHPRKLMVCCGPGCLANGAAEIVSEFKAQLKKKRIKGFDVEAMKETGCHGFCERGPVVVIRPEDIFYERVGAKDVPEVVAETIVKPTLSQKK